MKLLLDFFPIILFFVAFRLFDVYVATGVAMAATLAMIVYLRHKNGKVEPMQWVSLAIIGVFGGATLLFHNEAFIKWKPTVLYWVLATTLLAGRWLFKKDMLRALMGTQIALPDAAWRVMNLTWAGFFGVMGVVNLWVAFNFPTETWVNFKLFGTLGLTFVFVILQGLYMSRHMPEDGTPAAAATPTDTAPKA